MSSELSYTASMPKLIMKFTGVHFIFILTEFKNPSSCTSAQYLIYIIVMGREVILSQWRLRLCLRLFNFNTAVCGFWMANNRGCGCHEYEN